MIVDKQRWTFHLDNGEQVSLVLIPSKAEKSMTAYHIDDLESGAEYEIRIDRVVFIRKESVQA